MANWTIDSTHASADFTARHMMVSKVRGGFRKITGTIEYDPENVAASSVEVVIDVNSMTSTGVEDRDNHLKSADFLDVANYPKMTFKSTRVVPTSQGEAQIYGDLTIRDVTREVVIDAEFLGQGKSPYGMTVAGFSGSTKINREDFGLTWNMALETGGWLVGKEITIDLDLEVILQEESVTEANA